MKLSVLLTTAFTAVYGNEIVMQLVLESKARMRAARTSPLPPSFRGGKITCGDEGFVDVEGELYNCSNVDFLSFISAEELKIPGVQDELDSSDIWGWYDTATDREITILTLDTGVVFIDSTDPQDPCILSKHHSSRPPAGWGDIKVIGDFAYAIKDFSGSSDPAPGIGMEVYDLRKLRERDCKVEGYVIKELGADFVGTDHGRCHNVVSNTETKRIYSVGCRPGCGEGLMIFDVAEDPLKPKLIGCVDTDGYTHDAQCVLYNGPDQRYFGHEICLAFNEDTLTIWDVTFADDPVMLSRSPYFNQAYTHQGWFNYDMSKILVDDELDERCSAHRMNGGDERACRLAQSEDTVEHTKTVTYVWNVENLEEPTIESRFKHAEDSIDHNLYVWGPIHERGWGGNAPLTRIPDPQVAYLNNYMSGLIMMDIESENSNDWNVIGQFSLSQSRLLEYIGSWSGYMHPSGVYAISSIDKGIFFLDPRVQFVDAEPIPDFPTITRDEDSSEEEEDPAGASAVLYVFFGIFLVGTIAIGYIMSKGSKKDTEDDGEMESKLVDPTV